MSKIKAKDLHCGFNIVWAGEIVEVVWLQSKGDSWVVEFCPAVDGESCVEVESDREFDLV